MMATHSILDQTMDVLIKYEAICLTTDGLCLTIPSAYCVFFAT